LNGLANADWNRESDQSGSGGVDMRFGPFLGLAILLAILWAGGFVFFHVAGFLIHVLLILAVISLLVHFFTGTRTA
jgi:hypothetical protein